ncbi:B2 bradykinin receptor-like [Genypterus blacodes]|uniref:B2 bradykinin receptor-like n=1 Tax=Genypterus blacodes TaxID=154954 RepID=UPI003F767D5C
MTLQPTSVLENSTSASDTEGSAFNPSTTFAPVLIISVLGIVGNVFVLLVFCLQKKPCTVAEIYLSNLAAADLVLMSFLAIWSVNIANRYNWPFGSFLCVLVKMSIKMNACCSIYFLVLVSIDRYVALVHPMSHGRMRSPKYAKLCCVPVWGFGLLMSVPTIVFMVVRYIPEYDFTACHLEYPDITVQLICDGIFAMFSFIIPVCVISYCTVKIIQAVKNQAMSRFNSKDTENKATFLVLVVLLAFLICMAPYHLVTLLNGIQKAKNPEGRHVNTILHICHRVSVCLAFFNSALNPILYVIVGKSFREKVCQLFKTRGF